MTDAVAVALIAAVPATIGAVAAMKTRQNTKTGNGHSLGEQVDLIRDDVTQLRLWFSEHLRNHENERRL